MLNVFFLILSILAVVYQFYALEYRFSKQAFLKKILLQLLQPVETAILHIDFTNKVILQGKKLFFN